MGKTESAAAWEVGPSKSAASSFRRPMKTCQYFHYAQTIDDALEAIGRSAGDVAVLAGGTDLLLDIQQGRHPVVDLMVDITNIPEMQKLELCGDEIFIGAGVTHREIINHALIIEHAMVLVEACGLIGGPQVRNVATLGGNVAHALPAADGTIALMSLDARVEIASEKGRRIAPLADLFKGPGENTLDPRGEILAGMLVPLRKEGQGSAFNRVMRPQGVAIATLNCAVWLHRDGDIIRDVRIAIGPSGPTPRRLTAAESVLRGKQYSDELIVKAYQAVLGEASFRTSRHRATKAYREAMASVLLSDTFHSAWERAAGGRSQR